MKRVVVFFFSLLFLLLFPVHSYADDDWVIENFNSHIGIQQSGVVQVTETISVNFRDQPEHGIYRDIPYLYQSNGNEKYTDIAIVSILQNNTPAHYSLTKNNGYDDLKIGDPNVTVTGRNVYKISYTVKGILQRVTSGDELYWNVTGNSWPVDIQRVEADVTLPKNGIHHVICYQGDVGSQDVCQSTTASAQSVTFGTTTFLSPDQGMTIAVDWKKGLVPLLTAIPPKPYWERLFLWPAVLPLLAVVVIGIGFIVVLWYTFGRDYWFGGVLFGTKDQKGKVKPVGSHETISVEFTPPDTLRPAEIGVLMDESADTLDVTATIIDLATRGYLQIVEIPRKWAFGKVDYLLVKSSPKKRHKNSELLPYEQLLLDKLFYKRSQIKLSSLKATFYSDLKKVKHALYDDVVTKGLFEASPEKVRRKYFVISLILLLGGIGWLFFGFSEDTPLIGSFGLGFAVSGIAWIGMSRFMPRKTAYGRECYRRAKGYYLFINSAEKYRQRYFEKEDMFNEVLPYAIVFGITKKFAKQMEKMGVKPNQTDWYVGTNPFAMGVFAGNIQGFSDSLSNAMASTPSSSGGFSGGSSGGGFGGGGGGSW